MSDKRPESNKDMTEHALGFAERLLFGANSIEGTVRVLGFILVLIFVGGTLAYLLS
jgi:hypothetical protein